MEERGAQGEALRHTESAKGGVGGARVDGRRSRQRGGGGAAGGSGGHGRPCYSSWKMVGWRPINPPVWGRKFLHARWYMS